MKSTLVIPVAIFGAVQIFASASPATAQILSNEESETAQLNLTIQKNNADADARYEKARREYIRQTNQYDLLRQEYLSQMKEFEARNSKYEEEKRQNDKLQEQYKNKIGVK